MKKEHIGELLFLGRADTPSPPPAPLPDPFNHLGIEKRQVLLPTKSCWVGKGESRTNPGALSPLQCSQMEGCRKRLRYESTCSICLDDFTDPVTLDCGHNFCRVCIIKRWRESRKEFACPQCKEIIEMKRLRPNRQLANMFEVAKDLSDLLKQRVVPTEEAAQEWKDQIVLSMKTLRKEKKNVLVYMADCEEESEDLLKQTESEKEKITVAFRKLHQFLEEQEKVLLAETEEVEKEIARRRDEYLARFSGELSSLDGLIQELEEKQQQPENELQNIGDILERCISAPIAKNPGAFLAGLKWRIYDFSDRNLYMKITVKEFKDSLLSGLQIQEAKVTLDPNTSHPQLILSEDLKSVRRGDKWQDLTDNHERFDLWHCVLGREGFKRGRHFWDVAVQREDMRREEWAVGVTTKYLRRKGDFGTLDRIFDLGKWDGEYRVSDPKQELPVFPNQEVKKIRVTVNCPGKRIAFFDADTGAQLYMYSESHLFGEKLLPFFYVSGGAQLTLLS